jgi:hypothetical protein
MAPRRLTGLHIDSMLIMITSPVGFNLFVLQSLTGRNIGSSATSAARRSRLSF